MPRTLDRVAPGLHVYLTAAFCLVATLMIGAADWVVDPAVRLFPLYFVPVTASAWKLGKASGIANALVAIAVWETANHFDGHARVGIEIEVWNAAVQLTSLLAYSLLLSKLKESLRIERARSRVDTLTGIANSLGLRERAETELARARRTGLPVALAYIDLDGFKVVNDRFGHEVGNQVLAEVARVLQRVCRQTDVCARLGGDEFAILLPTIDAVAASAFVARIVENVRETMAKHGWPVTASVGCACFEEAPVSVGALLNRADALMYRSKKSGKDRALVETVDEPVLVVA